MYAHDHSLYLASVTSQYVIQLRLTTFRFVNLFIAKDTFVFSSFVSFNIPFQQTFGSELAEELKFIFKCKSTRNMGKQPSDDRVDNNGVRYSPANIRSNDVKQRDTWWQLHNQSLSGKVGTNIKQTSIENSLHEA